MRKIVRQQREEEKKRIGIPYLFALYFGTVLFFFFQFKQTGSVYSAFQL